MRLTKLPGTTIAFGEEQRAAEVIEVVTLGGGLVLSQVSNLTGLESHVVQNWVKRGFVSPPVGKKYSKNQFCRIVLINFLRQTLQLDAIVRLVGYINGVLGDEGDDIISDADLYVCLIDGLTALEPDIRENYGSIATAAQAAAAGVHTDAPDGQKKLAEVLQVMMVLYTASRRIAYAETLMEHMQQG